MLRYRYLAMLGGIALMASQATSATILSFDENDLSESTVTTTTTLNGGLTAPTAPALPADSTFTNPFNEDLAFLEGKFWRFTFDLPVGFSNLSFSFEALVNDEFAVYINDKVVAIQDDTGTNNFFAPLPGFVLNSDGTSSDTSSGKLDFLNIALSDFQVGLNEFTLYGTDTCCEAGVGRQGSLESMSVQISFDSPSSSVPEPGTMALLGLGMAGLLARSFKKRNRA